MSKNKEAKPSTDNYGDVDLSGLSSASREALVTHILEGMTPDAELIATLQLVDKGEIDLDEFVHREITRINCCPEK